MFPTTEEGYVRVSGFKASSRHPVHVGELVVMAVAGADDVDEWIGGGWSKLLEELAAAVQIV